MKVVSLVLLCISLIPMARAEDLGDYHARSYWSGVKGSEAWTAATLDAVRLHKAELDRAADLEKFCPGYREASSMRQELCWLRLFGGVAKFESNFTAGDSFFDGDNFELVGLLSIAVNSCDPAKTRDELRNPEKNIQCGVQLFAKLVARDGVISGQKKLRNGKLVWIGAATWWSTVRPVEKRRLGDRTISLGYQEQIIQLIDFANLK